jgi:RimJ/RimL family protein N-acetyltransferase
MDGFIDEIYLRPAVRGRGIALEALQSLRKTLQSAGLMALHLEVDREDSSSQRLYQKARFELRDRYSLMTLRF